MTPNYDRSWNNSLWSWGQATMGIKLHKRMNDAGWLIFHGEPVFPFALRLCHVLRGGLWGRSPQAASPASIPCSHIGMGAN